MILKFVTQTATTRILSNLIAHEHTTDMIVYYKLSEQLSQ